MIFESYMQVGDIEINHNPRSKNFGFVATLRGCSSPTPRTYGKTEQECIDQMPEAIKECMSYVSAAIQQEQEKLDKLKEALEKLK